MGHSAILLAWHGQKFEPTNLRDFDIGTEFLTSTGNVGAVPMLAAVQS